jgi:Ice-binding-like/IPTL-CTERM motif
MCKRLVLLASVGLGVLLFSPSPGSAQPSLGSAQSFAVLGASTVTNTGPTVVTGDLGVSPGTAITGFPPGIVIGTIHAADAVALQAQTDLTAAYNTAAAAPCGTNLSGQDLGGLTLTPGVYCFNSSAGLTGTLTLNAQGNPNAVFIFQVGSTLTTASNSAVVMTNGGSLCNNVFWQIGSSATLGTGTAFGGNILALASITLTTGASTSGRTLARTGAVTLDSSTVGGCASGIPASTIPTLSEWAMILFTALLALYGFVALRRRAA